MGRRLSGEERVLALNLIEKGVRVGQVATEMGVTRQTIHNIVRAATDSSSAGGELPMKSGRIRGRPPKTHIKKVSEQTANSHASLSLSSLLPIPFDSEAWIEKVRPKTLQLREGDMQTPQISLSQNGSLSDQLNSPKQRMLASLAKKAQRSNPIQDPPPDCEMITGDSIYDSSCIYESDVDDPHEDSIRTSPLLHQKNDNLGTIIQPEISVFPVTNNNRRNRVNGKRDIHLFGDDFEDFGTNVAAQLRRLPISRALSAQMRIQTVLTEERILALETILSPPPDDEDQQQLHIVTNVVDRKEPQLSNVNDGKGSVTNGTNSDSDSGMDSVDGHPISSSTDLDHPFQMSSTAFRDSKDKSKSDIIHPCTSVVKSECDMITLEEEDPFEGH